MGNKDENLEKSMYTFIKKRAEEKVNLFVILITAEASNLTSPAAFFTSISVKHCYLKTTMTTHPLTGSSKIFSQSSFTTLVLIETYSYSHQTQQSHIQPTTPSVACSPAHFILYPPTPGTLGWPFTFLHERKAAIHRSLALSTLIYLSSNNYKYIN